MSTHSKALEAAVVEVPRRVQVFEEELDLPAPRVPFEEIPQAQRVVGRPQDFDVVEARVLKGEPLGRKNERPLPLLEPFTLPRVRPKNRPI